MSSPLNLAAYYTNLASNQALSENETVALLKAVDHFQKASAYLADCHAATLESLPKSASKSARSRHEAICRTAAQLLEGDASGIRYPTTVEPVRARCMKALASSEEIKS